MAQGHARPDHTEGASVQPVVRRAAATGGREQSRGSGARAVRGRGALHARQSFRGRQFGQLLSDSDADAVRFVVARRVFRARDQRRRRRRRHADRLQKRRQSETAGFVGPQFRAERYVCRTFYRVNSRSRCSELVGSNVHESVRDRIRLV